MDYVSLRSYKYVAINYEKNLVTFFNTLTDRSQNFFYNIDLLLKVSDVDFDFKFRNLTIKGDRIRILTADHLDMAKTSLDNYFIFEENITKHREYVFFGKEVNLYTGVLLGQTSQSKSLVYSDTNFPDIYIHEDNK